MAGMLYLREDLTWSCGTKRKKVTIIFPNHGSREVGKGSEKKILKDAGINL